MSGHAPPKDHPWGPAGSNLPPNNSLSPVLEDLIYAPHDNTTTHDWIRQNIPNNSALEYGEGRLMLAIFINAIAILKRDNKDPEIWAWIMDKEADGLHSFNSVCGHLKWDPEWIRKLIIEDFPKQKPRRIYANKVFYGPATRIGKR